MATSPFELFMNRNQILVGIVVDIECGSMILHGNPDLLESDDLIRYYFTDATKLNQYLTDRILPTMLQQGKVAGVVCKPTSNVIVGLLYHDDRPVLERYKHSQVLDKEICGLWEEQGVVA